MVCEAPAYCSGCEAHLCGCTNTGGQRKNEKVNPKWVTPTKYREEVELQAQAESALLPLWLHGGSLEMWSSLCALCRFPISSLLECCWWGISCVSQPRSEAFLCFGTWVRSSCILSMGHITLWQQSKRVALTFTIMSCFLSHSCRKSAFFIKNFERENMSVFFLSPHLHHNHFL